MKIHPSFLGFAVGVFIAGELAKEYPTDNGEVSHIDHNVRAHRDRCTITNYIESVANKPFTVEVSVKNPYKFDCSNLSFGVYVDGQLIVEPMLSKALYKRKNGSWTKLVKGPEVKVGRSYGISELKVKDIVTSKSFSCPCFPILLKFVASEDMNPYEIEDQKAALEELGIIEVIVYRCTKSKRVKKSDNDISPSEGVADDVEVHKKVLKGEMKKHSATWVTISNHYFLTPNKHLLTSSKA